MKVYVSSESLTVLKFNSRISHVDFGNKDDYTSQVRDDDNSLVIKTVGNTASNTNLYVNEGKRGHLFSIVYLPVIDINNTRLFYDFSDLKRLKKLIEDPNQYTAQNTAFNQVNVESEEDKKAQYGKDSVAAAEVKKKADTEAAKIAKNKMDLMQQRKEEDAKLAKAKADAEAAQKAEELRLAKVQADAKAKKKEEEQRLAKAKADAEAAQQKEEQKLAKEKAAAEALQKAEAMKQAKLGADSIQKVMKQKQMQDKLNSIKEQKVKNAEMAKIKLDSIQMQKEKNAQLAKMRMDSIEAKRLEAANLTKAKLDSIQAKKEEIARLAAERKKEIEDSLAALPKFYSHVDLWKKYPSLVFEMPPNTQHLAGDYFIPADTLENARVSYLLLNDSTSAMQLSSNEENGVRFILQDIKFSGVNCFMKLLIQNKSKDDYLTGVINLGWDADSAKHYNAYPCFITSYPSQGLRTAFPVLAPGVDETIVLTTRALNVKEGNLLNLSLGDRLYQIRLNLSIPVITYLSIMQRS